MTGPVDPSLTTDSFSAEMFELLWGSDRGALPTAVDHAYEMIWKYLIVHGRPGKRLADTVLAAQLGMSRTPVRQALHRLAQEGLVEFDPRRGFWVRAFTVQDVHEIYDLRAALEVLALRLAAPALDPADLQAQLDLLHTVRDRLAERPLALFLRSDLRLHNLLTRASGNGRLIRFLTTLRSQLSLFQVRDAPYPGRMQIALDDHERILQALLSGAVEEAAALLAEHIAHAKAGVLADLFGVTETAPPAGDWLGQWADAQRLWHTKDGSAEGVAR